MGLAATEARAQAQSQAALRCIDKPRENGFRNILKVLSRVCIAKELFWICVDIGRSPRDEIAKVRSEYRIVEFTLADFEAGLATCKDTHGFYLFNRITGDRLLFCIPDFPSCAERRVSERATPQTESRGHCASNRNESSAQTKPQSAALPDTKRQRLKGGGH
jgi:hypothetical protein